MVAKFARLEDLLIGEKQPDAGPESDASVNNARDTIPDEEESGLKTINHPQSIIDRHLQHYRGTPVEIVDVEVTKQKFRYRLFRLLKADFLKPVYASISAGADREQINAVADERKKALEVYLKILEQPAYLFYLSDIIILQLSILISVGDWTTLDGINSIKMQISEILDTPVARPNRET